MRVPLLLQVLIAVVLGIVLGCFFPVWFMRIFVTFNGIFSQYLGFCIPLIIMGLVISGIAQLGARSGKFKYAEGFRRRSWLGFSANEWDPIKEVLGDDVIANPKYVI